MKKRVLIGIHLDSFFTSLHGIALLLKQSAQWEPCVLFAQRYPNAARDAQVCASEGIAIIGPEDLIRPGAASVAGAPKVSRGAAFPGIRRLKQSLFNSLFFQVAYLAFRVRFLRACIRRERIALVVLGGDVVHYDTAAYILAAHRERIPAVVVAGWMINQDENAEAFRFDPAIRLDRLYNRLIARVIPRWVYAYRGHGLLRLPPGAIIARELLGLAPPLPWTLHSGSADRIAVESEETFAACIREGLPAGQITVTGSINHDLMAEVLGRATSERELLCRELGFTEAGHPLLLSALPPDEFYRVGGRPECDFSDYAALVEFWVMSLAAATGWNIVVCLHPSLTYERMRYIEQWGVKIARRHTAALVPLCDLFVASVSTTIQWATACGKPVINYDVYRYRQKDYAEISGMISMEDQREFRKELERITRDRSYLDDLAARQQTIGPRWGRLDGHAGDRIIGLFDQLVEQYKRPVHEP